jgi:hypothetical protein
MYKIARNLAKDGSDIQLSADELPNFLASKPILWARGNPTLYVAWEILLSSAASIFFKTITNAVVNLWLRTLSAIFIVKSINARSKRVSVLNHIPLLLAFNFKESNSFLPNEMQETLAIKLLPLKNNVSFGIRIKNFPH